MVWQAEKCWQKASHLYYNINTLVKYLVVGKFGLLLGWSLANVQDQQSEPWRHFMDSSQMEHHRELLQSQKSWKWDFIRPGCFLCLNVKTWRIQNCKFFPVYVDNIWFSQILHRDTFLNPKHIMCQILQALDRYNNILGRHWERILTSSSFSAHTYSSNVVHNFSFFLQEDAQGLKATAKTPFPSSS